MFKSLKTILFIIILSFAMSCDKDEIINIQQNKVSDIQKWYNSQNDLSLFKNRFLKGEPKWESAMKTKNGIYVALSGLDITLNGNKHIYPILYFEKNQNKQKTVKLNVYFDSNKIIKENIENIIKLSFLSFNQDNILIKPKQLTKQDAETPERVCQIYGVYEHSYDPNTGETETTLLYTYEVCNDDINWGDIGSGGSGGGGSGSSNPTIDDKIDDDNLDPCSKAILDAIKNGESIENIINQFAEEDSEFNWTVETTNTIDAATTTWLSGDISNHYITKIDPDYKNSATKLSIARTIIHESIHAYILSYVDPAISGNSLPLNKNFPELFDDYVNKKYGDVNDEQSMYHHQEIARNYVNVIANALSIWDNSRESDRYYLDLAWGGLFETKIYNETTDLTDTDRRRIEKNNSAEDTNSGEAKGNPCN